MQSVALTGIANYGCLGDTGTMGLAAMITIKDIAEKLGVSPSTVARALADNKHISRATKDRVTAAARELGYVANSAARVMRGESNALVGLTIPSIENDIDTRLARSVAETCRARSYQLVLSITEDDPEVEFNQVHALVSARAAGLIAIPDPEAQARDPGAYQSHPHRPACSSGSAGGGGLLQGR